MNEIKIEKGVPIPHRRGSGPTEKYPFSKMKIGDSFLVQGDKDSSAIRVTASAAGRRLKFTFTVHRGEDGYRIWRIK